MSGTNTSATGGFVGELPPSPPTAKDIEVIFQRMVSILADLPGTLVRPRWQPTPPVQPPVETNWAAVGVVSTEADEYPWIEHFGGDPNVPDDLGHDVMQRHQTVSALVSFYGPEAEDHAQRMRDALYVPQNSEPFSLALQGKVYSVADFSRVPELVNQQWINRIDMRLMLRQQINRVYPILDIASALINVVTDSGMDEDIVVEP